MKTSTQGVLYVNETPKVQSNCLDIVNMNRKFSRLCRTDTETQPVEYNNYVEVNFVWQISYPPANGASLGSLFVFKI